MKSSPMFSITSIKLYPLGNLNAALFPDSDGALVAGKLDVKDVIQPIYDEINKQYGLNERQD